MTNLVFGSPGRYIQGPGCLSLIGEAVRNCGGAAVVIADAFVRGMVEDSIAASCAEAGLGMSFFTFDGELTPEALLRLGEAVATVTCDTIVAVGGGKCIDAGKALVDGTDRAFISVPTVASTDAPTSKNYVIYNAEHHLVRIGHLPASPRYVLVDTALISRAPRAFLVTGIADALTKMFEAEQCLKAGGRNMFGARPSLAGVALARECYRLVRLHAEEALDQAGSGQPTEAFERLVEAVLLMSGLGFESGGLSIAHAMTRGLSRVAGAKDAAHGMQVAYGLLVQLTLERREPAFFADLFDFYDMVGLPKTLRELGTDASDDVLAQIAGPTIQTPHTRNFERVLSALDLIEAMRTLETNAMGSRPREPGHKEA